MKKTYEAPVLEEVGAVSTITAALGSSTRRDFSEFPALPSTTGSFDACDSNPNNSPDPSFCM